MICESHLPLSTSQQGLTPILPGFLGDVGYVTAKRFVLRCVRESFTWTASLHQTRSRWWLLRRGCTTGSQKRPQVRNVRKSETSASQKHGWSTPGHNCEFQTQRFALKASTYIILVHILIIPRAKGSNSKHFWSVSPVRIKFTRRLCSTMKFRLMTWRGVRAVCN